MKTCANSDEACMAFLTDTFSNEERIAFEEHVSKCAECSSTLAVYREIEACLPGSDIGDLKTDFSDTSSSDAPPWSIPAGEQRLLRDVRAIADESAASRFSALRKSWDKSKTILTVAAAACVLLAVGLVDATRHFRSGPAVQQSSTHTPNFLDGSASNQHELDEIVRQRDQARLGIQQRDREISQLRDSRNREIERLEAMESGLEAEKQRLNRDVSALASERDRLAAQVETGETALANAQKNFNSLQRQTTSDRDRIASLEAENRDLSHLAKERAQKVDEQAALLEKGRDIRDLMTARNLYMAEVYDVGGNGKLKKPFGRAFYTKDKSLVFFAYDLDRQRGANANTSFQAWGQRGPDRANSLNLGVLYADKSIDKLWVLQYDQPEDLERIDAVFLTVEPQGGSKHPTSKGFLYTYLKAEPNHP